MEVGHVVDRDRREVGLARDGADAGELGRVDVDLVIARRVRVGEGDEVLRGRGRHGRLPRAGAAGVSRPSPAR